MHWIRVSAATLNQTPLDWDRNQANILAAIEQARKVGATLLCLPEMCLTGYGCEDAFLSPGLQATALDVLDDLLPATRGMVVNFGLPLSYRNGLFNCTCMVADREILGFVPKKNLAGEGLHYEPRWFNPWPTGMADDVRVGGTKFPIGDIFFDCGGIKVGFEICEDAWVAQRPGAELAIRGVDIILNPSASHFAFSKLDIRKRFVMEGSRAFGVTYIYSNLVGNEAGRSIYDGGALIASGGDLVACGERFSYLDFDVTSADVDIQRTRMLQARTHSYRPSFEDDEASCIDSAFEFSNSRPDLPETAQSDWEDDPNIKFEAFTRAISLALFDYMRKTQSCGFVVSLSGGADSSACACLVATMVALARQELGPKGFCEALSYLPQLQTCQTNEEIVKELLLCAYQGTVNSSSTTREAARTVAHAVGAEFKEFDIDELVEGYTSRISRQIGRELTWETDDLTLQNIQARVRGPGIWMFANIRNALLMATSNRSEAAVGYATMDGDTCGGISPIAGIDKAFLLRWLRWMETVGPDGIGPIAELSVVNDQQPTAELRPQDDNQTDEGDLMPYVLLDSIERAAIRDKMTPLDIFLQLETKFPNYTAEQLSTWVQRFFNLWSRNQWKRERYAPSFHVDDENLDPKTWCRFPILSGGFKRELKTLRCYVNNRQEAGEE